MIKKLKKMEVNKFTYTKKTGSISEREVFIVGAPSDLYFGIDLSEFSDVEKEIYIAELQEIYEANKVRVDTDIEMLGLSSCYRNFKKDGVS